ncbi:molybdopterin-dependent oxidoreductase [Rhodococcus hoagii]|uniref:molybdopterin-dependent oxidoreductase n=1 Tax=Rhodococcus hoagii TaxID=43767 RepID=UPI000A1167BA|nr:molybdopterin-dependent oxidoreductase [Prescottella equi]MBM4534543.1 molybdopterin-dependent oxidoreductase [Prescottella equi]NKR85044.1 molybdopterin-dependent oxidoreductase [Prescottella equi]ORJ97194.1 oxidoreductase [Prescottella equi]ORL07253.1 oxidoreductase [Prescottella equi]ORL74294.1 oxidoreductase [Prescottella equi]
MTTRALSGILAAAVVLGIGQLVSVPIGPPSSPFFAVGSTTVDRSPAWAREFAITTFGTNDKPALFVGMTVLIVVLAAVAGMVERPRRPYGSAILLVLGLVGVYAAVNRPGATASYALPTIVGVAAGIVTLRVLTTRAPVRTGSGNGAPGMARRRFLVLAATAAAVAAAAGATGRYLADRVAGAVRNRDGLALPTVPAADRAPALAPGTDVAVPGATPFVTRNGDFYRIDTALQVPMLTTDEWQLRIHGMVDREITLSWDDLIARTPIERAITLTCVSNEVGGELAGNATWVGYRIKDLLDEVGVAPDADMLLSTSADGFTVGTPVEVLRDGRDAILAVAMNGEPLPFEHGYPVRQVVPGLYGFVSATKWVVDWELTRFDRAEAYWTRRGWAAQAPIKTASRIDVPAAFGKIPSGPTIVAGTAWAQHRGIEKVEVRVDNGVWRTATLAPQYSIDTWRQWTWQWDAPPGVHSLQVRATDRAGNTQTEERAAPIPDGASGWHSRTVTVS